jgi:imidazolonepropionase-like amidohydrolase
MKPCLLTLLMILPAFSLAADGSIAFIGGTVIDGTGADARDNVTILVEGDRITAIGNSVRIPADAQRIDASGKTILPGFIDAHVHFMHPPDEASHHTQTESLGTLRAFHFMELSRKAGITAARDTGGSVESMQALVQGQSRGYIDSMRMYPVGQLITTTGGHGPDFSHYATGPWGFREAVRKMYAAGFKHIKLSPTYTQEEVNAAVDEAKTHGMQVTSHGGGLSDTVPETMTERAVLAGVESIEHVNKMPLHVLDMIAERGIHLVPTLAIYSALYDLPVRPANLQYLVDERGWSMEMHEILFKEALKRDILMGIGTDAVARLLDELYPQMYFDEMEYFVTLGMSRLEAITAATRNGAIILAQDRDLGTLEQGKFADLQIVDGNPLETFEMLGKPSLVMIRGRILSGQ